MIDEKPRPGRDESLLRSARPSATRSDTGTVSSLSPLLQIPCLSESRTLRPQPPNMLDLLVLRGSLRPLTLARTEANDATKGVSTRSRALLSTLESCKVRPAARTIKACPARKYDVRVLIPAPPLVAEMRLRFGGTRCTSHTYEVRLHSAGVPSSSRLVQMEIEEAR